MDEQKIEVRISVRNLVEFLLRSGDINSGFAGSNKALEGSRMHRKIQKAQGEEYLAEVTLCHSVEYDEFILTVEGRADGIIDQNGSYTIDEIKTTSRMLEEIDEDYEPVHWAQAKCYAYIFSNQKNLEEISVRLTYCQLETEEIKYFVRKYTALEIKDFFQKLLEEYYFWAKLTYEWNLKRNASIKGLEFPFREYRKGQREMAVAVYKTIGNGKKLFVNAPTGTGKTISTVFPSVKALGEGLTSKIFYLTAKTITRSVAEEAFAIMRQDGLNLKTITLTAKEKICFLEKSDCNPLGCEFAKGHFDRVNEALREIIISEDEYKRDIIVEYAQKHRVCPFEFSLDLTMWADVVICDYNYVFDPRVYLKRYFTEKSGDYTFLIDEAHNLVDRSREMFSAELFKKPFLKLRKDFKELSPKISKTSGRINSFMLEMKKLCGNKNFHISKEQHKDLYYLLLKLVADCEEYLVKNPKGAQTEELLNLYFDSLAFIKISEFYDDRYVTLVENNEDVKIKLFCLDPSYLLGEALKRGRSAVFFSATLTPMNYFREILGGSSEDYTMHLESPFDVNNRCLLIADRISTRYKDRERSKSDIADLIKSLVSAKKGNYLAFFPSYQYMNMVYEVFTERYSDINTYLQEAVMTEHERENFLSLFKPEPEDTFLAFCVLGGVFSEGIDLKNDRLIGTAVVGVGLPLICTERDVIKDYFQDKNAMGFEYAYMYPGMNKVLQAAGRVIRTEEDRGVILLIDDRFSSSAYKALFPRDWFSCRNVTKDSINESLTRFWING